MEWTQQDIDRIRADIHRQEERIEDTLFEEAMEGIVNDFLSLLKGLEKKNAEIDNLRNSIAYDSHTFDCIEQALNDHFEITLEDLLKMGGE